jgi:endo-1,4-beta-xylanase
MPDRVLLTALLAIVAAGAARGDEEPSLKELVPAGMLIGAALNQAQSDGQDDTALRIVTRHFNTVTAENLLKWENVHPEPDRYEFGPADRYVAFGHDRGLKVIGHTLLWHQQTPAWVFEGKDGALPDRETLLNRLRTHIEAVAGRYRGRIHGWDVVNEALEEDGTLRKSPWLQAIGEDYIEKAFELASQADPDAELYYNDFNLTKPEKRAGALRIVRRLRDRGLRVDGIGEQGHWLMDVPAVDDIDRTIADFTAAGMKTLITELDVDVLPRDPSMYGADLNAKAKMRVETNLYPDGLPAAQQEQQAKRYADVFGVFMRHRGQIVRVTFWGVTDAQTWLHNFPIPGRVNHPLLWDRSGRPKPAFDAVVRTLKNARDEAAAAEGTVR